MSAGTSMTTATAESHYTNRAAKYDEGNSGWHIELGREFVEWLFPIAPGSAALDLACGTGLVTIPLAKAVGQRGKVIGIDLTTGMLDMARSKQIHREAAEITWIEHDVTDLDNVPEVQDIVEKNGGFDVISCCSALVLLPNNTKAITSWAKLLKSGGRMIIDIPTEDKTLQYLFAVVMLEKLGLPNWFDRSWVKDISSLEKLFQDAGLVVEKSWRTRSYLPEKAYSSEEWEDVWQEQNGKYKDFINTEGESTEKLKAVFKEIWCENLDDQKRIHDGHWLYVAVGTKP